MFGPAVTTSLLASLCFVTAALKEGTVMIVGGLTRAIIRTMRMVGNDGEDDRNNKCL